MANKNLLKLAWRLSEEELPEIDVLPERMKKENAHFREQAERLKDSRIRQPRETPPARNEGLNLKDYIILEGRSHGKYSYPDLLVSMEKEHYSLYWEAARVALDHEDSFMLTIRQYVDFLSLLKSGDVYYGTGKQMGSIQVDNLLDRILLDGPQREAEWLDAKFEYHKRGLMIVYHKIGKSKGLVEVATNLPKKLIEPPTDKGLEINLEDWLGCTNPYGLPEFTVPVGDVGYYPADKGRVTMFASRQEFPCLNCWARPSVSRSFIGARAAKVKE